MCDEMVAQQVHVSLPVYILHGMHPAGRAVARRLRQSLVYVVHAPRRVEGRRSAHVEVSRRIPRYGFAE